MEGVWRPPSPAGNVRGSGSTPRRRLEMSVEVVPRLAAGRKCSVEVVPNLGAGCVKPWNWFQTSAQAGNALWKRFQASAHAAQPLGSGFKPHFRASRPFGRGSKPISRLPGALEVVPRRFPGCATPHAGFLAVPPPPSARMLAVATNIVISWQYPFRQDEKICHQMLRNIFLAIVWIHRKRYFCGGQM